MLIPYPISESYMLHWNVQHAVREVLQNAIDSGQYLVTIENNNLVVTNHVNGTIDHKDLLWFGCSNKNPGSIGKFGEGFKLALLILARAKISHKFSTPTCDIRGVIANEQFHIELLETTNQPGKASFVIEGFGQSEVNKLLLSSCTYKLIAEYEGNQCIDLPGHVYVNGLLVTDQAGTMYGYNFRPSTITLDRDRQTVSDFELSWETSRFLANCLDNELLAELMYKNVKDVQHLSSFASKALEQACYAYAVKIYGVGVLIARSEQEARVWRIMNPQANVVYHGGGFGTAAAMSSGLKGTTIKGPTEKPSEVLLGFFERNKKHVRAKALKELKAIVEVSTSWIKK